MRALAIRRLEAADRGSNGPGKRPSRRGSGLPEEPQSGGLPPGGRAARSIRTWTAGREPMPWMQTREGTMKRSIWRLMAVLSATLLLVACGGGGGGSGIQGTAPAAPSGLEALATSSSTIHLTWTEGSSDQTGFLLERSPDNSSFSQVATPRPRAELRRRRPHALDHLLLPDQGGEPAGDSGYSNTATATTSAPGSSIPIAPFGPHGDGDLELDDPPHLDRQLQQRDRLRD